MAEAHTAHRAPRREEAQQGNQQLILKLEDVHCPGCADAVERTLRSHPHITSVHLDWANNVAHVSYDSGQISHEEIERLVTTTGCKCAPNDRESVSRPTRGT